MTGGSLGFRTGSNGSLQQQQQGQNGQLQPQKWFTIRKSSKGPISGARENERCLPWLWRHSGRKDVGMLILVAFAFMAFMTGWFTLYKEDRTGRSDLDFLERFRNQTYHIPSLVARESERHYDVCSENYGLPHPFLNVSTLTVSLSSLASSDHPCKNFAFPPPPPGIRRRIGHRPCPVCYIPVEQAIASMPRFPSPSPVLQHLTYIREENSIKTEPHGGSDFGGYPSLKQRSNSFNINESMTVHCGFVKGCRAGEGTGFDIDEADLTELDQFHDVIVASAIFGNYDLIQQPKNVSEFARSNVPFYMFVDEETEAYMKNSSLFDSDKRVGLWRIIVVHNIPYSDSRRNGKVPKLLLHRLFPNVRFSIWIDGKLQLVVDPYQILERFLWRHNATFAISRHYKRFDVFEEAEANKAGGKYDNVSIDTQIDFYKKEGLTPYSRAKLPITSDVPEGCVIVKEHIPITNLFTCLWFNEVDRFTSRDQLSFSTVRDKITAKVNWSVNMFLDCERRNFVVQAYHRDLLEQRARLARARSLLPPAPVREYKVIRTPAKKTPIKRVKGKKPGSKRHRKAVTGDAQNFLF